MSLFNDYIEEGLDTCKFVKDGMEYTAIIKKVSDNSLLVKQFKRPTGKMFFRTVYKIHLNT